MYVNVQVVNPFLQSINKLEERTMFRSPGRRGEQRTQQRRIMQMVGVTEQDWIDSEEVLRTWTTTGHRAAVKPFSQDQEFAEGR